MTELSLRAVARIAKGILHVGGGEAEGQLAWTETRRLPGAGEFKAGFWRRKMGKENYRQRRAEVAMKVPL